MQLVRTDTRKPVKLGDTLTSFRGEAVELVGIIKPHKPESTGRVIVQGGGQGQYFPSVFGLEWEGRTDQD